MSVQLDIDLLRSFTVVADTGVFSRAAEQGGQGAIVLARIGRACGDVDQGGDFGIDAGFADHGAGPRVADEHSRPILQRQYPACRLDIVGE